MVNRRSSLDPRWTKNQTSVAAGFMTATVRVIRKDPNVKAIYDPATKTWQGGFAEVFVGKARVQPYGITGDQIVGQDPTGRRLMRVQIENKVTLINIDDMLEVIDCPDNPELTLFTMEVRSTISSSNSWLTDLVCEADLKRAPYVTPDTIAYPSLTAFPSPSTYPTTE